MKDLKLKYQNEIDQINKKIENLYNKILKDKKVSNEIENLIKKRKILENKIKEIEINAFRNLL